MELTKRLCAAQPTHDRNQVALGCRVMSEPSGPPTGHGHPQSAPVPSVPGPQEAPFAFAPASGVSPDQAPRRRGLWIAITALTAVVGLVAVVGAIAVGTSLLGNDQQDDPVVVASEISSTIAELTATIDPTETVAAKADPTDTSVVELVIGTCFDDPTTTDQIESVPAMSCDGPHGNEVFAVVEYPAGLDEAYPGRKPLAELAQEECNGQVFTDYVGLPWRQSQFMTSQLTPTEKSWAAGDREIVCLLYDTAPLVGSVRGSQQ